MTLNPSALETIATDSDLVNWHMEYMRQMVRIDSRSLKVNEFKGDRETPSDMQEILRLAEEYLRNIGFPWVMINQPPENLGRATPILLAEIKAGGEKPTILLYAHLDKQPYMDDETFSKWDGVPPWELRWNADKTRAYGRGAADDLSGVIAIGMAVDGLLKSLNIDPTIPEQRRQLPCNIKVIYETEEEAGSVSLTEQILQNRDFFKGTDCVVITDVVNPAQGIPGLTTSLRGVVQQDVTLKAVDKTRPINAQTALYKLLTTLVHDDHALAVAKIACADTPLTASECEGYALVPTSVEILSEMAGLLPGTRLAVSADKVSVLAAQLRKSYVNVRPGHRVSGNVVFGAAGARLTFRLRTGVDPAVFKSRLMETLAQCNPFNLKINLKTLGVPPQASFDLIVQSANKDPHSGVTGGPFPIPEIQLARMIDRLIRDDGHLCSPALQELCGPEEGQPVVSVQALFADHDGSARLFEDASARALVEIRLAPGNQANQAAQFLKAHLVDKTLPGFAVEFGPEKDGSEPWMTAIDQPVFTLILEALEKGYAQAGGGPKACLYGCGGSIPFVKKLTTALGKVYPLCIGAYDPDSRMHEPNESLSMPDVLGCARSMVYFMANASRAFPKQDWPLF